ncbi:RNA polymerase sigma factor SigJ [Planotetraspora phitsanulokensis]|uniref:RNA polymerase sigma24 factor n=1 Tax=Planotetraspora phitsanulokensis TaxID=575192 RepID=A0A8J3UDA5_9ACTN|nr:RNA polymerase sigma factor SigJ [Planotetraspora phitsanulokensis]GII42401.1 RNA polymerase sigma24 factor [Planotetraspora phitsanulokensis]
MPGISADGVTRVFADHRELLFSIVYNMLGSVADTEDVLQETWLSWASRNQEDIGHPRAYLVRIAVNQALARQTALSRSRETYVGPWLPEPLLTSGDTADEALRSESVSMALLVVLETLTPLERAVFVLHEVFGYAHTEIAETLGRSPSAIRQLAHRAREHVRARRPRYQVDRRTQRQVTERFVAAAFGGDLDSLLEILAPEVTLWTDGGGKATAAGPRPIHGRDKVARLLVARTARPLEGLDIRFQPVNGDLSAVVFVEGSPFAVIVVDLAPEGDRIRGIYTITNPDKLTGVH